MDGPRGEELQLPSAETGQGRRNAAARRTHLGCAFSWSSASSGRIKVEKQQEPLDPKSANTRPGFTVLSRKMKTFPRRRGRTGAESDLGERLEAETIHFPHTLRLRAHTAAAELYTGGHVTRRFPGIADQSGAGNRASRVFARDAASTHTHVHTRWDVTITFSWRHTFFSLYIDTLNHLTYQTGVYIWYKPEDIALYNLYNTLVNSCSCGWDKLHCYTVGQINGFSDGADTVNLYWSLYWHQYNKTTATDD